MWRDTSAPDLCLSFRFWVMAVFGWNIFFLLIFFFNADLKYNFKAI